MSNTSCEYCPVACVVQISAFRPVEVRTLTNIRSDTLHHIDVLNTLSNQEVRHSFLHHPVLMGLSLDTLYLIIACDYEIIACN